VGEVSADLNMTKRHLCTLSLCVIFVPEMFLLLSLMSFPHGEQLDEDYS